MVRIRLRYKIALNGQFLIGKMMSNPVLVPEPVPEYSESDQPKKFRIRAHNTVVGGSYKDDSIEGSITLLQEK
jgi:hypothetical protein